MDSMRYFNEYDKVIIQNLFRIDLVTNHEWFLPIPFKNNKCYEFCLIAEYENKTKQKKNIALMW